jgi:four helix bundle protein
MFDHERLDVYRYALEFDELVAGFSRARGHGAIREQLDRASVSILACIAEGAGRRSPADKRRFYGIARGSATECTAHLDAMKHRRLVTDETYNTCRVLLLSLVRMLSRLSAPPPPPPPPAPARAPAPNPSPVFSESD